MLSFLLWSPGFACTFLKVIATRVQSLMSQAGSSLFAISDFTLHWNPKLEAPAWVQLRAKKSGPPQLVSEVGFLCSSSIILIILLPTMASSQKPKTRSASRSAAAWAGASEGDAALGKPVAVQDADASLGLPIAVVDAGEEMPPTFSPGPAGDVVDLTPELAQKMRAETDQVQSAEATGLQLPRPVSPPVGQTSRLKSGPSRLWSRGLLTMLRWLPTFNWPTEFNHPSLYLKEDSILTCQRTILSRQDQNRPLLRGNQHWQTEDLLGQPGLEWVYPRLLIPLKLLVRLPSLHSGNCPVASQ